MDNCLKILKGCEIEYRDRITELAKDHKKLEEENQKLIQEDQTWLPEIIHCRQGIREMTEILRILVEESGDKSGNNIEIKALYSRCKIFLTVLNDKQSDLEAKALVSSQLNSEFSFLDPLRDIEKELDNIGRRLYNLLPEDEQRNKAMNLLEKISMSPPLYKVKALEEYFDFLSSEIDKQANFSQAEKARFKNILPGVEADLNDLKDRLTDIVEPVLDDMQMKVIGGNMQHLRGIINKLEARNQEPRLSGSNLGMR